VRTLSAGLPELADRIEVVADVAASALTRRERYASAAVLRIDRATVYRMVESGELRAVRIRGRIRIPWSALEEYLAANAVAVPQSLAPRDRTYTVAGGSSGRTSPASGESRSARATRPKPTSDSPSGSSLRERLGLVGRKRRST
jgi:excisionase family DNA binding protein